MSEENTQEQIRQCIQDLEVIESTLKGLGEKMISDAGKEFVTEFLKLALPGCEHMKELFRSML